MKKSEKYLQQEYQVKCLTASLQKISDEKQLAIETIKTLQIKIKRLEGENYKFRKYFREMAGIKDSTSS